MCQRYRKTPLGTSTCVGQGNSGEAKEMGTGNSHGLKRHSTLATFCQDVVHGVHVRTLRLLAIWNPKEALSGAAFTALLGFSLWCWYLLISSASMLIAGG